MRKLRSSDVFRPGTFPEHTYVSRIASESTFTYEFRLEQALNTIGYLTSIVGPSKTGKTVLCEKVIGMSKMVSMSGSDFRSDEPFWTTVARKIGLAVEDQQTNTRMMQGETLSVTETKGSSIVQRYLLNKDMVIQHFLRTEQVLVLDDFHYAPEGAQFEIVYQLKDAIRYGFRAVIISLPHRADDAVRRNADLSGRLSLINIEPWKVDALKQIAVTGFGALEVHIDDVLVTDLAVQSLTSPQLMQSICLNLSMIVDIDHNHEIRQITDPRLLEQAYRATTPNLPYQDVVRRLKAGPPTRGQKRMTYQLPDGEAVDVYSLLLKAITVDPPIVSISIDELKVRIDKLLGGDRPSNPDRRKIRTAVEQIQAIIQASEPIYHVFEWKDDLVYILEPLFLFYLRWGTY